MEKNLLKQMFADNEVFFNNGKTAYIKGNYQESIRDFTEAIRLDPNYAKAYTNRGMSYNKLGDYSSAIRDCTQAIRFGDYELLEIMVEEGLIRV